MDDAFARLEADFCPPIDSALFSAIVSDYDLNNEDSLHQVQEILEQLKATAVAEEATGFDPSGSTAHDDGYSPDSAVSPPSTSAETSATSRETELSSLSNAVSSLDLIDHHSSSTTEDLEGIEQMDPESKTRLLKDLVPSLSQFTVAHSLKKHQNGFRRTLDDLLNQVYLSENGSGEAKGIEAFLGDESAAPRGRKKKKGKKLWLDDEERRATSLPTASHKPAVATNKWQSAAKDIDFIASHLDLPREKVSSIYNQESASMQRTIASILGTWLEKNERLAMEDVTIQVDACELGNDFPSISERYRIALIGMTQPSTAGAHELAQALVTRGTSQDSLSQRVIPQYAPLQIAHDEDTVYYGDATGSTRSSLDLTSASARASALRSLREDAMSKASIAYRKSRSDRLMGGAAAYYSQVSRDARDMSQAYTAAAADSLVATQSGPTYIDLHGVTVEDAKRITRTKVNQWWDGLGENRYNGRVGANDRAAGFRIVTGAGKHSKGGKGVLGPAVKKVLEQDGWRIEYMSGEILVRGKGRV